MTPPGSNIDTSGSNLDTSFKKPKRLAREKMEKLILETCKENYLTIEEISKAVDRNLAYLQNSILPILVKEGKLLRQYPGTPNHPDQAYKSA